MSSTFAELLKARRVSRGISQEALAERAHMSVAAVSALERGTRRAPYRDTVTMLADALELSGDTRTAFVKAAEGGRARASREQTMPEPARARVPSFLTSFVGRSEELAQINGLLELRRLVTVTGSGGVGKTRAVCELLGRRAIDACRVAFVQLAPLSQGDFVLGNIAGELGLTVSGPDAAEKIAAALRLDTLLLVLDNCEHLLADVCSLVRRILRECPGVTVLATSRERLGIAGETIYRLPSLEIPSVTGDMHDPELYSASALFMHRVHAVDPRFEFTVERVALMIDICRAVDGIPLAIELAVGHVPALGMRAIRERLTGQLVLTGGDTNLPKRQQTMETALRWSYDLLGDRERHLLGALGVFAGSFSLRAAEIVCSHAMSEHDVAVTLVALVEKSLVNVFDDDEGTRYSLFELTRAFALERLAEAGELITYKRRHAGWLANLGDRIHTEMVTVPRMAIYAQITSEIENVRAALEWALASGDDRDVALAARIVGGLRLLWLGFERFVECRRWIELILPRIDAEAHAEIVARLYRALIQSLPDSEIEAAAERAVPALERIGDREGLISLNTYLVAHLCEHGKFDKAELAAAAAATVLDDPVFRNSAPHFAFLCSRAVLSANRGAFDDARRDLLEAQGFAAVQSTGHQELLRLSKVARVEALAGNFEAAVRISEDIIRLSAQFGDSKMMAGMRLLGFYRLLLGKFDESAEASKVALQRSNVAQGKDAEVVIQHIAAAAALRGQTTEAAQLFGFLQALYRRTNEPQGVLEQRSYTMLEDALQKQLSAAEFERITNEGSSLQFRRAIEIALAI